MSTLNTERDPFTLTEGSSFSASNAKNVRPGPSTGVTTKLSIQHDVEEALEVIGRAHVSAASIKPDILTDLAITSMLKVLDPHSNYYDPDEFQELLGEHASEYSGTGSSIAGFERDGRIETFVISTFPDSPAARAGMRFGDRIIAVNGRTVTGETPDTIRDLIRGKRGSGLRIVVERADTGLFEPLELKRDRVHEPAVPRGSLLKGNIGYIDLSNGFSNATFPELENALAELHKSGMSSLILDLRGNGGGILEQAIKVAEKFLPAGSTIVSQRGRYPNDTRTWKAAKAKYETVPLVLLVDEHTASASEVLAGALQDNDRALIVGTKTFGKGLVQSVLDLPDGAGLTLTAARYFTPTGRSIQRNYSDTGLYDYFHHRQTAEIGTSVYVARTLTGRVVYGGNGISPDVVSPEPLLSERRMRLLDPIFFFSLKALNTIAAEGNEKRDTALRKRVIDEEAVVNDVMSKQFYEFAAGDKAWSKMLPALKREETFVRSMIRYYLEVGTLGTGSAKRSLLDSDPQVAKAIRSLPGSAQLALAAQKLRAMPSKEKSSLSLVLSEQR